MADRPSIGADYIMHGHGMPGGRRRRSAASRAAWMGGGAALIGYGAIRGRGIGRLLSYLGGSALVLTGLMSSGRARRGGPMAVWRGDMSEKLEEREWSFLEANIVVDRPIAQVYEYMRNVENWPRVFTGISEAHLTPDGELMYAFEAPRNRALWWRGRIVEDYPEQIFTWQSEPDNIFDETGSLRFEKQTEDSTRVTLAASFRMVAGIPGMVAGETLGRMTEEVTQADFMHMKDLIERAYEPVGAR